MTRAAAPAGAGKWTRRGLLRAGGGLAAVAGVACVAGCTSAGQGTTGAQGATGSAGASAGSSGASAGTGQVRSFRSRPDLRPVATRVRTDRGGTAPGLIVTGPYNNADGQQGPMIVGNDGDLVWFRPLSEHGSVTLRPFNVRVQEYRGEKVLTWFQGAVVSGHGQGSYVIADSSYRTVAQVHAGNGYIGDLHEFLITDADTALFTCYGQARADLTAVGGAADGRYFYGVVQEVDIATSKVLFQWRCDRHVGFAESYAPVPGQAQKPWDPYHINSISVAADGNLIVSLRNTSAAYKVERPSGRVLWRLGGKNSDFTIGSGARFAWQHDVRPHPGGALTVFDNGAGGASTKVEAQSRGLLLAVDEQARQVTLTQAYVHSSPSVLAAALGSVQLLPDGHVFVGWGQGPFATEYRADGTVLYDLEFEGEHTVSYRAFRSGWTGRPSGAPAVAAEPRSGGLDIYVSWNGDTEVRHWRVLLGSARDRLSAQAVVARKGFETKITVARRADYVAVAGLDASGRVLGRSAAVRVD
jgi:Arylsulfotransferase (ASST)